MAENSQHQALILAVSMAGGQSALAEICGCQRQSINQAMREQRGLPAQYVNLVSTALKIPRHLLRPDLYPVELEP